MISKVQVLVFAAVVCLATVSCYRKPSHDHGDADVAATSGFSGGGGGAGGGGGGSGGEGKFYQFAHHPEHDLYEMGYHRGNHHHYRERHEKAAPHAGQFKTKVRWGDKKGGHGEHLWDYNHDGHDGHDGGN